MSLHVLLAGWLSVLVAPLPGVKLPPMAPGVADKASLPELDAPVNRAPRLGWRPGAYTAEALKLPEVLPLEKLDMWQQGPGWPQVEVGVVVVTDHADDPARFMAFLVDVKQQRVAAVREGDKLRHLLTIGQMAGQKPGSADAHGSAPTSILTLAGSGAVIIVRPPVPPGPAGVPRDLVARMMDAATLAAFAGGLIAQVQPI